MTRAREEKYLAKGRREMRAVSERRGSSISSAQHSTAPAAAAVEGRDREEKTGRRRERKEEEICVVFLVSNTKTAETCARRWREERRETKNIFVFTFEIPITSLMFACCNRFVINESFSFPISYRLISNKFSIAFRYGRFYPVVWYFFAKVPMLPNCSNCFSRSMSSHRTNGRRILCEIDSILSSSIEDTLLGRSIAFIQCERKTKNSLSHPNSSSSAFSPQTAAKREKISFSVQIRDDVRRSPPVEPSMIRRAMRENVLVRRWHSRTKKHFGWNVTSSQRRLKFVRMPFACVVARLSRSCFMSA